MQNTSFYIRKKLIYKWLPKTIDPLKITLKDIQEYSRLSKWSPEDGAMREMYDLAIAGHDREEVKRRMDLSDNHFNVTYKRLKEGLSEGVLQNRFNGYRKVKQLRFGVRKQYESAMMLLQTENKAAGIPLARAAMRKAEKYGLYQVALDLSRELTRYFGTLSPNTKLYQYYRERQKVCLREVHYEINVEQVFFDFVFNYKKGRITDISKELQGLSELPSESFYFHYIRYYMEVVDCQIKNNVKRMLNICHEALSLMEKGKDIPYQFKYSFRIRLIPELIGQKEFSKVEILLNQTLSDGPMYGQHNWQQLMYYRAVSGLHSGKPAITKDTYEKAVRVPKKYRTPQMQDIWRIIGAWLALFQRDDQWRLGRFLNSLEVVGSDKAGHGAAVLIIELLHLLKGKQYERYRHRCERLNEYITNHLKGKDRATAMLRLFQCVVRGGFDRSATKRHGWKYLPALSGCPTGTEVQELELLPFDRCWKLILDFLSPKT